MNFDPLGPAISGSAVISALDDKLSSLPVQRFRFADHLNSFAERVSAEVKFVPLTFPEFTDHSADIHFPNLFALAAKLLGETVLRALYPEELFVFAAALYAHDWGMAVSPGEREFILTGKSTTDIPDPFWMLPNERERFQQFASDSNIELTRSGHAPNLAEGYWREYVRLTHADRSAIRAHRYFLTIDGGVAQAVASLCKGHWLDIEAIDAERDFPAELNVLNARINLRALALFLRLVDRFDISEDRTPFAIWRFVGPRNPGSQGEWKKHRALRPVHTERYLSARCVVVDGTASDPDVYADLLDLRDCCEKELRETCDLLARHHDERLPFDLAPIIHWNVKAQGFEPVEIRFAFDRKRMFEILGGEIYQGDPCVFLRELLQNAIDAIATRRALQARRPREGIVNGLIEFLVQHEIDGSCVVQCRDNGIGMDDYIIRRYLAVAGKSYYRSDDFVRLGLSLDPISRFGIGLLSCFMVASRVQIVTRRDPTAAPNAKPLRIEIPAPERQWRVYRESSSSPIGTTVIVDVKGESLFDDAGKPMPRLPVTEYISSIAGFVEFPVLIEERTAITTDNSRRTMVIHPYADPNKIRREFGTDVVIHQLSSEYPFESAFVTDDAPIAREHFKSDTTLLGAKGCDGFVVSCRLKDETIVVREAKDEMADKEGIQLISPRDGNTVTPCLGLKEEMRLYLAPSTRLTRSAGSSNNWSVYLDGILLPGMPPPKRWQYNRDPGLVPLPIVRFNYQSRRLVGAAVSRLTLERDEVSWENDVWNQLSDTLRTRSRRKTADDAVARSTLLANNGMADGLTYKDFASATDELSPLCAWVTGTGKVEIAETQPEGLVEIPLIPHQFSDDAESRVSQLLHGQESAAYEDTYWRGPRSLLSVRAMSRRTSFVLYLLARSHTLESAFEAGRLQFLRSPRKSWPPFAQQVLVPCMTPETRPFIDVIDLLITNPKSVSRKDRETMSRHQAREKLEVWNALRAIPFAHPFKGVFAYGSEHWNSEHPTTVALLQAAGYLMRALYHEPENNSLKKLRFLHNSAIAHLQHGRDVAKPSEDWDKFWKEFRGAAFCVNFDSPPYPEVDDFVPGMAIRRGKTFKVFDWDEIMFLSFNRPFGELIVE